MTSSGDKIESRCLYIPIVHVRETHYECGFSVVNIFIFFHDFCQDQLSSQVKISKFFFLNDCFSVVFIFDYQSNVIHSDFLRPV